MAAGKVAPAPLINTAAYSDPPSVNAMAVAAIPILSPIACLVILPVLYVQSLSSQGYSEVTEARKSEFAGHVGAFQHAPRVWRLLRGFPRGCGAREGVAEIDEAHAEAGVRRRGASGQPRIALKVGVLEHQVECSPLGISSKSGVGAERNLLDRPVLPVARDRPIADQGGAVGIACQVLADKNAAIVGVVKGLALGELEASHRRSGANQRQ